MNSSDGRYGECGWEAETEVGSFLFVFVVVKSQRHVVPLLTGKLACADALVCKADAGIERNELLETEEGNVIGDVRLIHFL